MTNPTRQEIISAHEALTNLLKLASGKSTAAAIFNERIIRNALPPMPRPTMADVGWDNDKHYLAEAELKGYGPAIMLWEDTPELITVIREGRVLPAYHEELVPTGKRYTLTEVQE